MPKATGYASGFFYAFPGFSMCFELVICVFNFFYMFLGFSICFLVFRYVPVIVYMFLWFSICSDDFLYVPMIFYMFLRAHMGVYKGGIYGSTYGCTLGGIHGDRRGSIWGSIWGIYDPRWLGLPGGMGYICCVVLFPFTTSDRQAEYATWQGPSCLCLGPPDASRSSYNGPVSTTVQRLVITS